jgi:hypothetical protein
MIRIPAIAIRRPRTLPRGQISAPEDVVNGAEEALRRNQNLALAEKRKERALASAALDGRIFL